MEIVVLSGKGGTGKTTITNALTTLAEDVMRVDCDVDAPNLYLYYQGTNIVSKPFIGEKKAVIDPNLCTQCGLCENVCRFDAIKDNKIDPFLCEGCGACKIVCPNNAISFTDEQAATTYISDTGSGLLSHAQMEIGSDGSGKLITQLRKNANDYNTDHKLTFIDGSPGIGCSVISSITGSNLVLLVTEPTKSGMSDLKRVVALTKHFDVNTLVCINKYDINTRISDEIKEYINEQNIELIGMIPFDSTVMKSINELKPITNYTDSPASIAIVEMWDELKKYVY